MKNLNDRDLDSLIDNEREWRRYLTQKVDRIEKCVVPKVVVLWYGGMLLLFVVGAMLAHMSGIPL